MFQDNPVFSRKIVFFYENHSISAKNTNFCELCEKICTFSERGCHFCELCEKDARFPWVEFVDFPNNSLNVHEQRTFSEKGCHVCEFCEKDARFPRVEFVDKRIPDTHLILGACAGGCPNGKQQKASREWQTPNTKWQLANCMGQTATCK